MKITKGLAAVVLAGLLCVGGAASAEEVITDGYGKDATSALHDAARTAIEQVTGAYVQSKTQVEMGEVAKDSIMSKARGYIRKQEIISQDTQNGQVHVKARIDIDTQPLQRLMENPIVGIPPFLNKGIVSSGINQDMLNQASDYATVAMLESGKFQVVERTRLMDLVDEYDLNAMGLGASTAERVGQLTGAQYLLIGSINAMTTRKASASVVGMGTKKWKVKCTVTVRLVDVDTGQVVLAAMGKGADDNTIVKAPFNIIRIGTAEVDEGQVDTALEEAVNDAINGPQGLVKQLGKIEKK